jgi:hypothetical protein
MESLSKKIINAEAAISFNNININISAGYAEINIKID